MTDEKTLIIGIGNSVRGDDALGLFVVEELRGQVPDYVDLIIHDGEPASLIECWQGADFVILVDAVVSGCEAGTIFHVDLAKKILPDIFSQTSTHAFGVAEAVELARALGKLPPRINFYGIEGKTFETGDELSFGVISGLRKIKYQILESMQ